jgi:excinuclease ABC subunit C
MKDAAVEMKFEDAAKLRDQIEAVKSVVEKQQVVSLANEDYDALGMYIEAGIASVVVLVVRGGKMLGDQHSFLQNIEGRGEPEVLSAFVRQHYEGPTGAAARDSHAARIRRCRSDRRMAQRQSRVGAFRCDVRSAVIKCEYSKWPHKTPNFALREHLNYNATAKAVHDALLEDLQKHLKAGSVAAPHRVLRYFNRAGRIFSRVDGGVQRRQSR